MCFDRKIAINKYNTDTGCIIDMVKIVDCVTKHKSPYFGGPYGWVVGEAIDFEEPVNFTGKVGILYVPFALLKGTPAEKYFGEV